jgi:hypothetical protein
VPKPLKLHDITWFELLCLNLGILTSLALALNGIVQMDSSNNVTLCWLPGSGIIWNKSWLLPSQVADAQCVKLLKVSQWGIHIFNHPITQETIRFIWSCLRTMILTLGTL